MPIEYFGTQRAMNDPLDNLVSDPVTTRLVLGRPSSRVFPAARIWPRVTAAWKFSWYQWGDEHLELRDTRRPLRAPYEHDESQVQRFLDELIRYSWSAIADKLELRIADEAIDYGAKKAQWGRRRVQADIERITREAILNVASYPVANVITLGAGDEFNAATGDSKAAIEAAVDVIMAAIPVSKTDLSVYLPNSAYRAALSDPLFMSYRKYTVVKAAVAEDLQAYWGTGPVWTSNERHREGGVMVDSWGDTAVIYFEGAPDLDTEYGEPVFGRTFAFNDGIASMPVDLAYPLSGRAWPWDDHVNPKMLTPSAAVLLKNTSV